MSNAIIQNTSFHQHYPAVPVADQAFICFFSSAKHAIKQYPTAMLDPAVNLE